VLLYCALCLHISRTLAETHGVRRRRQYDHAARCSSAPRQLQLRALDLLSSPCPPPAWLRTALRLTLLLVGLFTCQSIRTSRTLTAPELRLHACASARTLDCCALPAAACECWPAEQQLTPHPPVVTKSCSNPRAHKAEVHYQRGTLASWFCPLLCSHIEICSLDCSPRVALI